MQKLIHSCLILTLLWVGISAGSTGQASAAADALIRPATQETLHLPERLQTAGPLRAADLAGKKEGWYLTGLPLVNYDTDNGVGYGVRAYLFANGVSTDPWFAYLPYQQRFYGQFFQTTGGWQYHALDWELMSPQHSSFSLKMALVWERNTSNGYFGIGTKSAVLRDPVTHKSYRRFADYDKALRTVRQGTVCSRYNQYDLLQPTAYSRLWYDLQSLPVRLVGGVRISHATVDDYSGAVLAGEAVPQCTTRLAEDARRGLLIGTSGGWDNTLLVGLAYDSRDYAPDPNRGAYVDLVLEKGTAWLGSDFAYQQLGGGARGYLSPISTLDLVFAGQLGWTISWGEAPFFTLNHMVFAHDFKYGLGGYRTMRGYRQNRFIGAVKTMLNLETRWTFVQKAFLGQQFAFMVVPFADLGRTYTDLSEFSFADWHVSGGGGLRIAWNQATIFFVDMGFSREDSGIYINFDHIF